MRKKYIFANEREKKKTHFKKVFMLLMSIEINITNYLGIHLENNTHTINYNCKYPSIAIRDEMDIRLDGRMLYKNEKWLLV